MENEVLESLDSTEVLTSETVVEDKNITVNVVMPSVETSAADISVSDENPSLDEETFPESAPVVWTTTKTLDEGPSVDGASLSSMVQTVFGEYVPRTQTVTEVSSDGSSVTYTECVPGLAGLDWYWLAGVALFSLVLLSFFKLLGGIAKR